MKRTYFLDRRTNTLYNYENAMLKAKEYCRQNVSFDDWVDDNYDSKDLLSFFRKYDEVTDAISDLDYDYEQWVASEAHSDLERDDNDWHAYEVEED